MEWNCAHTTSQCRQLTIIHQQTSIISQNVIVGAAPVCSIAVTVLLLFAAFLHIYSVVCLFSSMRPSAPPVLALRGKFSPPLFGADESTILHNRRNAHTMGHGTWKIAYDFRMSLECVHFAHGLNINYDYYRRCTPTHSRPWNTPFLFGTAAISAHVALCA